MKRENSDFEKYQHQTNKVKVFTLLFLATFFDFVEFILTTFYINKYVYISSIYQFNYIFRKFSLDSRCYSFLVICNSFTYQYSIYLNKFYFFLFLVYYLYYYKKIFYFLSI